MQNLLLQLDTDPQPSMFDAVVAADSGADVLFRHGNVTPEQVAGLVHGLIFTRSPKQLNHSAIFVGGANVERAESLLAAVTSSFFGPLRVSVMLDGNGANTTAAAAVLCGARHLELAGATALVLGGTGPVGQRAARLLAQAGAQVRLASRKIENARKAAAQSGKGVSNTPIEPVAINDAASLRKALNGVQLLIAAGAAGVRLVPQETRQEATDLRVVIDLNAVPPVGLEGIETQDKGTERDGQTCYGAIGVGGTKMVIHQAAIGRLFERNDLVLDAEEIFALGQELETQKS